MDSGRPGGDLRERRPPWDGKRVVLGVCGGIAAYKVIQVARDLTLLGAAVDVVLTEAATRFVTPLSFEGVTGRRPLTDLFSAEGAALHVRLGQEADAICVAPATADFLSRSAAGRADDLLTTVLLASEAPVVVAPAMNDRMFAHAQTQANAAHLSERGYLLVGPAEGRLAVGEGQGPGRLVEPGIIVEALGRVLEPPSPLVGKAVLVTAGPTREALDPVRYLGNRSSGKMGYALAQAAWRRGADVTLVSGPTALPAPWGVERISVESAGEMEEAVLSRVETADVAFHAAAVADYRPSDRHSSKIKREAVGDEFDLRLFMNPDIASQANARMKPGSVAVGFALETDDLEGHARRKLEGKAFHLIVANRADTPGAGFESDTNKVWVFDDKGGARDLPLASKAVVAGQILDLVEGRMGRGRGD
ncbi:MAG: bifunctional phosphopantothenoylcysteine decarboxylase/phosphopantothenate--cysteine ligase CoaBC [Gemmatimonadota bacterium]|nr:bifunctional phosphopantothenoylcysteine decarboxylase/phosphopantothenate--cysteine ligase CoaBC [Gemmatimonadota bacterium]